MRISSALAAIMVCLPAAAFAQPRWTFCVAASKSGADVWITDVFAASHDRVELESAFKAMLVRAGAGAADAQCPEPREDKTEAVNAEFEAEEFNRKLGASVTIRHGPQRRSLGAEISGRRAASFPGGS